jgi:hypothetical protein
MSLPFSAEQFFGVFEKYNNAVWPAQIVLYVLAAAILYFVFKPNKNSSKIISAILAFFWLWMGVVYHWVFFSPINPAAKLFALLFIAQGALFAYIAFSGKVTFSFTKNWRSYLGLFFAIFGPVIYPIIGYFLNHKFPSSPTFGLPCPTTIFTLGILLMATRLPKYTVIIPFIWSLIGFSAAISLGVKEDISLLVAGVVSFVVIMFFQEKIK